nr:hypothetical protein [Tanacetum cinerariifolium]
MMKAQVHVSKSFAISGVQALPLKKQYCQIYQNVKAYVEGRLLSSFQDREHEGGDTRSQGGIKDNDIKIKIQDHSMQMFTQLNSQEHKAPRFKKGEEVAEPKKKQDVLNSILRQKQKQKTDEAERILQDEIFKIVTKNAQVRFFPFHTIMYECLKNEHTHRSGYTILEKLNHTSTAKDLDSGKKTMQYESRANPTTKESSTSGNKTLSRQ